MKRALTIRVVLTFLMAVFFVGCSQDKPELPTLGPDEGINGTKINRSFHAHPMINQVVIRTPLTDALGSDFIDKVLVFKKKIGEDDVTFDLELNGRNDQKLNDVNKGRIVICFDDGKVFEYSKKSVGIISIVLDYGIKGSAGNIGTISGVLMGSTIRDRELIYHLKRNNVTSFSLESFETVITKLEAEDFRKNVNTVMDMK